MTALPELLPTPVDPLLEGANKTWTTQNVGVSGDLCTTIFHLIFTTDRKDIYCTSFKLTFLLPWDLQIDILPKLPKNSTAKYLKIWKLFCPRLTTHNIPSVLPNKHHQLTDTVGFGPILLFPLRHQQSPLASTAIWEQTQPSNSTEFCHPDVERATQRRAAGRHI